MAYPPHIDPTERRIIDRIVRKALKAGYTVSVYDGEEWSVEQSTDWNVITPEIASTDETTLRFRTKTGGAVGAVLLIHGNGSDVIADYSDNPETEAILAGAEELAANLDDEQPDLAQRHEQEQAALCAEYEMNRLEGK